MELNEKINNAINKPVDATKDMCQKQLQQHEIFASQDTLGHHFYEQPFDNNK